MPKRRVSLAGLGIRGRVAVPIWAIVVALGLMVGALVGPRVYEQLLRLSASPPQMTKALPDYRDVPRLSLSYSRFRSAAMVLSDFEVGDRWTGVGIESPSEGLEASDAGAPLVGRSSLRLRSRDRAPARVVLRKKFDLSHVQLFEMYVRVSAPNLVGGLEVRFHSRANGSTGFRFPIRQFPLTDGPSGWFPARMPRAQFETVGPAQADAWADIGAVSIRFTGRPGVEARVDLDLLRGEGRSSLYREEWTIPQEGTLGLFPAPEGVGLLVRNVGGSLSEISEIGDARDFTLTAKVTPLTPGRGGLLLRGDRTGPSGYSFVLGGAGSSSWQLLRTVNNRTDVADEGTVSGLTFVPDEPVWLQARVQGSQMRLALSRNGQRFTPISTISDIALPFGAVGLAVWDASTLYVVHHVLYERIGAN